MMQKFAVGGGTALAVWVLLFGVNWFREMRALAARSNRKLEPWEKAARDAGLE
jgi:hypothetical protein